MERHSPIRIVIVALMVLGVGISGTAQAKPKVVVSTAKWLFRYDESIPYSSQRRDVRRDPQFRLLLEQSFHQEAFFWNIREPAWKVASTFLEVGGGEVKVKDSRYGIISGCVPHMCDEDEGFLWVDTDPRDHEVIFAALTAIPGEGLHGAPSLFHLWIFSNHSLRQNLVGNEVLPDKFLYPMQDWIDEIDGRHVVSAMFVGPDNRMTPLLTKSLHLPGFQETAQAKTKESQ